MKKFSFLILSLCLTQLVYAQTEVSPMIKIFYHDEKLGGNYNIEDLAFIDDHSTLIETYLKEHAKGNYELMVTALFDKDKDDKYLIFSSDDIPQEIIDGINKITKNFKGVKPRYSQSMMFGYIFIVGKPSEDSNFMSKIDQFSMYNESIIEIQDSTLDIKTKVELIQAYAKEEVIPLIGHILSNKPCSANRCVGVIDYGKDLSTKFNGSNVAELTDENHNYWRAIMEMELMNEIVPISKIFMHIANGEFDIAINYYRVINNFKEPSFFAYDLLTDLEIILTEIDSYEKNTIKKGIALHDQEKYDEAIAVYEEVLAVLPKCAFAKYELFLSTAAKNTSKENEIAHTKLWYEVADEIYEADPFYDLAGAISSKDEAFLFERRQSIQKLFKSKDNYFNDYFEYGNVALDLGEYSLAGLVYWHSIIVNKDINHNVTPSYFLYCLNKLGHTEFNEVFNNLNMKKESKKIEKERKVVRKECSLCDMLQS